ncbi:MAG: sigma-70 family RNA polymerase sigma factor [Bacteroidota bacterium]
MPNESQIWTQFQHGSVDAYEALYSSFAPPLYSYGMKFTSDVTIVEDSIHDVFCTLWTSRERLSQPASVKNYLFKSLRNSILRKSHKPFFLLGDDQNLDFHFELAIDEKLTQNEDMQFVKWKVAQALEKLSSRQREIIYYRFYQNLEFDEIADIMNMQVRATYKLTSRALETLRGLLPAEQFFSTPLLQ